jgi:hypothetical protein
LTHDDRKFVTLFDIRYTTITLSTYKSIILRVTTLKDALTTSGNSDIKVVVAKVITDVGSLHNHTLSLDRRRGEHEFITRTTRLIFRFAVNSDSRESIGKRRVDSKWRLVATCKRWTAITPGSQVGIGEGLVVFGTCQHRSSHTGFV